MQHLSVCLSDILCVCLLYQYYVLDGPVQIAQLPLLERGEPSRVKLHNCATSIAWRTF